MAFLPFRLPFGGPPPEQAMPLIRSNAYGCGEIAFRKPGGLN